MGNEIWEMGNGKWEKFNMRNKILSAAISDNHTFFPKRSDAKFKERKKR